VSIDKPNRQAAAETTSVYTGVATFPMLPGELSTDLTSLLDSQDRVALFEDKVDKSKAYALRVQDPVEHGRLYQITREKAVFLLTEMGISRSYTLELKKKALESDMITLRRSGLIKAALGLTTLEEVLRETIL
jgi:hypothetical protein